MGWGASQVNARSCVVVVGLSGKQAGFLVGQVADILPVNHADVKPCPEIEIREQAAARGLVQLRGGNSEETLILLDLADPDVVGALDVAA